MTKDKSKQINLGGKKNTRMPGGGDVYTGDPNKKPKNKPKKDWWEGMTPEEILSSNKAQLLPPAVLRTLKDIVKYYPTAKYDFQALTPEEVEKITQDTYKTFNPYYDEKKQDIFTEYDTTLKNNIIKVQTELDFANKDLERALADNDAYHAEQLKTYTQTLKDTLGDLDTDFQTYTGRKQQYLETELANTQEDLKTGLGRVSDDQARQLRQIEKQYTKQLDTLQENMTSLGYTFSSKRETEEADLSEAKQESASYTMEMAKRQAEDLSKGAERYAGSAALQGIEGALLKGGVAGTLNTTTAQEIEDITNQYNRNIRGAMQSAEQQLGTAGAQAAAGGRYGGNLVGDIEGGVNRSYRQTAQTAQSQYDQLATRLGMGLGEAYGQGGLQRAFGSNYARFGNVFGQYGGTGTAEQQRDIYARENEYARADAVQKAIDYQKKLQTETLNEY